MFQVDAACDFHVSGIKRAVERAPTSSWRMEGRTDATTHYLSYCLDGAADYVIEGEAFRVSPGDLLLLPASTWRSATCDENAAWRFYCVGFTLVFAHAEDEAAFHQLPRVLRAPSMRPLFEDLVERWHRRDTAYMLGMRGLIEQALCEIIRLATVARHNPYQYACIEQITRRMQANPDHRWNTDELASEAGFSTPYFRALFKRVTGRSVVQYQNYLRINQAKALLSSGAANVTEASHLTGFCDIYYFSRMFKRITGHAPSYYMAKGEIHHGSQHSV